MPRKTIRDYLDSIYHYSGHLPDAARALQRIEERLARTGEPKGLAEMLGDAFREIGILILVFCVIEVYLGIAKTEGERFRISAISLAVSSLFLGLGLLLERYRKPG